LKRIDSRKIRSRSEESEIKEMKRGGSFNPFMLYRVSTVLLQMVSEAGSTPRGGYEVM
jgi:hypothetical protein